MLTPQNLGSGHVINMASRPERYAAFVRHIRQDLGWQLPLLRHVAADTRRYTAHADAMQPQFSFAPWVDEAAMPALIADRRQYLQDLTAGAVGCAISHASLWAQLVGHKHWPYLLVFEDDACYNPTMAPMSLQGLCDYVNAIPDDWDVLCLGGKALMPYAEQESFTHVRFFFQTHAYIVKRAAAWPLTTDLYPLREPVDYHMSRKIVRSGLRIYMLTPPLLIQTFADDAQSRESHSDVQTNKVASELLMSPTYNIFDSSR